MPALEARGVELSWSERGRGEPVLLIHETATGAAAWDPVARAVAEAARALSYDRRGWGGSSAPDGYRRTTIEEQSEDAAALLESEAGAPATVCGAGIGAVIALDLLLRRPELVSGLVLVEPPLLALVPAATEAMSADLDALAQGSERGREALAGLYLSGSLGALGAGAERLPDDLAAAARERPASLVAELGSVAAWAMPLPRLAEAGSPSLVVTGPSTPGLLREAAEQLVPRLTGAEARELGSGPLPPHLDDPAAVAGLAVQLARG
jgi:pimeloyl-ACP methyl ester carboxylesterase